MLESSWPEGSDFVEPVRTLLHLSRAAERIQIGQMALPDPSLFAHLPLLTPPPGWTPLRSRTPDVHIFQHPSGLLLHVGDLDQVHQGEVLMRGRRIGLSHLLYWPAPDDLLPLVEHFIGRRPFFAEQEHLPPPSSKAPQLAGLPAPSAHVVFANHELDAPATSWEMCVADLRALDEALHVPPIFRHPSGSCAYGVVVPAPTGWRRRRMDTGSAYWDEHGLRVVGTDTQRGDQRRRLLSIRPPHQGAPASLDDARRAAEAFDGGRYQDFRSFVETSKVFDGVCLRYAEYTLPAETWGHEAFLRPTGRAS